ncbi:MAG: class I SAM-dependent methyltransferase [Hyphomicrobiales bacterium]
MAFSDDEQKAFRKFERSGWEKAADPYHHYWGGLSSQSANAMLDAARVGDGSAVLDVATGPGYLAGAAYGRGAQATGIDFSPAQVALAKTTYPECRFLEASAEDLPFDDDGFDAVVIGFGMNHLPEPEAALVEAHRVLRPGGMLAFTVWAEPNPGEGFGIVLGAIEAHGEPDVDLPKAPPYFLFADENAVREICLSTGFVKPATRVVPQYWHHTSPDEVFDAFHDGAVRAAAILRAQSADARNVIRAVVRAEIEKLKAGEEYIVPVPAALSCARKP